MSPLETGTSLVVQGCDGTLRFDLPAARAGNSIAFSNVGDQIAVDADFGAAGIFATAASLPSFTGTTGYTVACDQAGAQAMLPMSNQYGFYALEAFAFEAPVSATRSFVRAQLYPATHGQAVVSTAVDLGPVWQAAVEAAKLSPLYAPCGAYCAAWNVACAQPNDDTADCGATCTIAGEAFPHCSDEYEAYLTCLGQAPDCNPQRAAPSQNACSATNAAWQNCAKQ